MDTSSTKQRLRPLLVNIQSVNTQTLDFNGVKSRSITCVEATNLFLIVGCASGTTYIFSRESLKFLFVIGFKGGKVCHISCSPEESDLAIGSVRGKVSLYRLSPNLHVSLSTASSPGECFRHLYAVPHHTDGEVTEMKWSPNGKFLFIGDGQGIISQVDVGSLEEFPRPPPSQIILKVNNRVLQMDCVFPYLAVCCISGVFLCDLEKEDFTRVKNKRNKDIKATGICLKLVDKPAANSKEEDFNFLSRLSLIIGEIGTGRILRCNMQGKIVATEKVKFLPFLKGPGKIFDPKSSSPPVYSCKCTLDGKDATFALGKLHSGENHYIITLLNDRLFIIDSNSWEVLFWCEDFQRIHSLTLIANYMFMWNGNKVDVVSFTDFRAYSMQLLNAGLHNVLERWISHVICSVGWKKKVEEIDTESPPSEEPTESTTFVESNSHSVEIFETFLGAISEDDPLCSFLTPLLPFELPTLQKIINAQDDVFVEQTEPFVLAVDRFVQKIDYISNNTKDSKNSHENLLEIWTTIQTFYTDLGAEMPPGENEPQNNKNTQDHISLAKIISKVHTFIKQPQLVNLPELFENQSYKILKAISRIVKEFLTHLRNCETMDSPVEADVTSICFVDYNKILRESGWFSRIGISDKKCFYDTLLADALLLITPLLTQDDLLEIITSTEVIININELFCTWIVVTNFLNDNQTFPYAPLLRTLQSESLKVHPKDVLSRLYQDLFVKDISRLSKYLHHFVSAMIFAGEKPKISRRIALSSLLSSLPFKNWPKKETMEKIETLCTENEILLKIFQMACLEDGNSPSVELCDCGLPSLCMNPKPSLSTPQKVIEEGILKVMVKSQLNIEHENSNVNEAQDFAMRRLLLEPYLKFPFGKKLTNTTKTNLILRTGSFSLLSLFPLDNSNDFLILMKKIICFRNGVKAEKIKCDGCQQLLSLSNDFQPLTEEVFALWVFNETGSIHKLMDIIETSGLNDPNNFSLRFYQQILKRNKTVGERLY